MLTAGVTKNLVKWTLTIIKNNPLFTDIKFTDNIKINFSTENMASFPTALLYTPRRHGGLGITKDSDGRPRGHSGKSDFLSGKSERG